MKIILENTIKYVLYVTIIVYLSPLAVVNSSWCMIEMPSAVYVCPPMYVMFLMWSFTDSLSVYELRWNTLSAVVENLTAANRTYNTIQLNTITFILRGIHTIVNISSIELFTNNRYKVIQQGYR